MNDNANTQINDSQLNDVTGGSSDAVYGPSTDIKNSKGQTVGRQIISSGVIIYWPCPKCGKPMHRGSAYAIYCDPCDDYYFSSFSNYPEARYKGTAEQLGAESL